MLDDYLAGVKDQWLEIKDNSTNPVLWTVLSVPFVIGTLTGWVLL